MRFDRSDSLDNADPVLDLIAGEYQLDVVASSGTPGAYAFNLSDIASATEITPGTAFSGEIAVTTETDLYKFDANAGDKFFVDVEVADSFNSINFRVVDPLGTVVATSNRFNDLELVTAEFDGTYTLLVEARFANTVVGDYTLNVAPILSPTAELEIGRTTVASLSAAGEQLEYTFTLDQEQDFFFLPSSDNRDFLWSLSDAERTLIEPQQFFAGFELIELQAGDYTITVDATGDFVGDISFFTFLVGEANELAFDGSITSGSLDSDTGVQVYSFAGNAGDHFALLPDYDLYFTDSATASATAENFVASADPEDGYSGLNAAFRADVFRDGAAINYILVTDEDRDVEEDNLGFEDVFGTLTEQSALLNLVTSAQFRDDTNTRAIGVDSDGNAYIADGAGGFTVGTGGFTTTTNVSFLQDYIALANATNGASWDLGLLRAGGVSAESFTNAFIDVKVDEILEQTALRLIPSNLDADFEVNDPTGGVFTDIIPGETYDFDIRIGNTGQPIAYDLLFTQGQSVGSIPVFIISPYEYGASAIDADGDALTWSLVSGPEGLAIDSETGLLVWTAEGVIFGEHEITIRVDDGRGGFDEQTFVLDVNGGEAASISGRVQEQVAQPTYVDAGILINGGFEDVPNSDRRQGILPSAWVQTTGTADSYSNDGSYGITPGQFGNFPGVTAFEGIRWIGGAGGPADSSLREGFAQELFENLVPGEQYRFTAQLHQAFRSDLDNPGTYEVYLASDNRLTNAVLLGSFEETSANEWQYREFEFIAPTQAANLNWLVFFPITNVDATSTYPGIDDLRLEIASDPIEDVSFNVFVDANRNGLREESEASTVTDVEGRYSFSNIAAGTYPVAIEPIPGWSPDVSVQEVSLSPGEDLLGLNFFVNQVPLVNTDPVIISDPVTTVVAGELYQYSPTIEELDGDTLTFDTPLAPAGVAVNPNNGTIRWTPSLDQIGTQNLLLRVSDGNGGFDLQFFQVEVVEPNSAPVITSTPPTGPAGVGLPYQYRVSAVDAQQDAITFSVSDAPDGLTIDPTTGVIDWTPTDGDIGVVSVTIVALDERGLSSEQTFDLTVELNPVNVDPVFLSEPPIEVRLGDNYLYRVQTFDQNGDPTTLSLAEGPDGLTLDADGLIVWQPGPNQLGEQSVVLVVEDGRGGSTTQEFAIDVKTQPVNFPPEITSPPLTAAIAGEGYVFQPTAEDRNNDTLIWTLENAPFGATIDPFTGLINWDPGTDEIGVHDVTIQVIDTQGAFSELVYQIQVRAVNSPPVILTSPNTSGAIGSTYLYQVGAEDVDQDRLTFSLVSGPEGLTIDANTGLVQWTPGAGQDGSVDVEIAVSDSLGASVNQAYTIEVADGQPNQLPVITSTPGFFATVDNQYTYQIVAEDPDGDEITYTLLSDQAGLTVDATTGLLEWTPTAGDLGTTLVEIVARDPAGGGSIQQFSLTVLEANNAPVINSTPLTELASGQPFRYDILASDADGDFLTYELVSGPEGFLIDGLGRTFWIPGADQLGDNDVEVRVTDTRGAFATQSFTINVASDTTAPQVVINLSDNPVDVGSLVDIRVQAIDNVGVETLVLTVDGLAVPLDSNGNARVELDTVGSFTALATATDAAGNSSTDSVQIFVADPNDVDGPVVSIVTPGDGDSITAVTDIIGSVQDDTLVSYRLLLAEFGTRDFTEIGSGTENVDNDVLGQLDPTLLQNGSYVLRLEAFDAGGNGNVIEQSVEITGDLKLGNFQLAFTDLVVPVAGIPIQITRVYDTLQADTQGEFGLGFRLEFRDTNLQVILPESGLEDLGIFTAYQPGTRVYLDVPGEGRQGFTFDPVIRVLPGFGNNLVLATPRFTADPGVTSTLSVGRTGSLLVNDFGELTAGGGVPYNPASPDFGGGFTLTTQQGFSYSIDGITGELEAVSDLVGNTITFSDQGVFSDSGVELNFERDTAGRIVSITDSDGNSVEYEYTGGFLTSSTDRNGNVTQYVYDPTQNNFLTEVIDPLGRSAVRSEFDDEGRLTAIVDAAGNRTELSFDVETLTTTGTDALGNETIFQVDNRGNVVGELNALGELTSRTFDANDNLLTVSDALGNVTSFTYDASGNILAQTNPDGTVSAFTFDNNLLTSETDELGNTTSFEYDGLGQLTSSLSPLGEAIEVSYGANGIESVTAGVGTTFTGTVNNQGQVVSRVDPAGVETRFSYDVNGNLISESRIIDEEEVIISQNSYDAEGRLIATTDALGNETFNEFDAAGQLVANVDANGNRTEFIYNEVGLLIETILPDATPDDFDDNPRLLSEYDLNGRLVANIDPLGRRTELIYDALGRVIATVLPDATPDDPSDNPRISIQYDAAGRVIATIDELGNRTENEYDQNGNLVLVRDALGNETTFQFDAAGRQTALIDPLGNTTSFVFDDNGRQIAGTLGNEITATVEFGDDGLPEFRTDPAGNQTVTVYNEIAQLTEIVDALGGSTQFTYDELGELSSQIDANGNSVLFTFDLLGRQLTTELELGQVTSQEYDGLGNVISQTDFNGNQTSFTYDARNLLQSEQFSDGTSTNYQYDLVGNLIVVVDERGSTEFEYDVRDRLVRQSNPDGTSIEYQYDARGNRTSVTTSSGTTQSTYDPLNRLQSVIDQDGNETQYQYDAIGRLVLTEFANGTSETTAYDDSGRVESITLSRGDEVLESFVYTYDANGFPLSITEADGRTVTYEYDALGRLVEERITDPVVGDRTISYGFDAASNRTERVDSVGGTTTYTYDANDRLVSEITDGVVTTYTYDDNGNTLTRSIDGVLQTEYQYDSSDQLISVDVDGDGNNDVEYVYDAFGNLVGRTTEGERNNFLVDVNLPFAQVIEEYTDGGIVTASFVFGNQRISQLQNGERSFFHHDLLGSTRALTDINGIVTDNYTFDSHGRILDASGTTPNQFLFNGEQRDLATGLDYLRARFLNTDTGRFLTRDSFPSNQQLPISISRYLYANGNPAVFTDPSGQISLAEIQVSVSIIATNLPTIVPQVIAALNTAEAAIASFTTTRIAFAAIGVFAAIDAARGASGGQGPRVGLAATAVQGRFFGEEASLALAGSVGVSGREFELGIGISPAVLLFNINSMFEISVTAGFDARIFPRESQFTVLPEEALELFEQIAQANLEFRLGANLSNGELTAGAGLGFNAFRGLFTLAIPFGTIKLP